VEVDGAQSLSVSWKGFFGRVERGASQGRRPFDHHVYTSEPRDGPRPCSTLTGLHRAALTSAIRGNETGGRHLHRLPQYHANPQVYCVLTGLVMGGRSPGGTVQRLPVLAGYPDLPSHSFQLRGGGLPILLNQPEREEEKNSPAKKCFGAAPPRGPRSRFPAFGLQVCELYGMSETGNLEHHQPAGKNQAGFGEASPGSFEVKIFDDQDEEVPPGKVGEFAIRPKKPFIMFNGYYRMPEETLKDFGNLWFHTGDLGKVDGEGYFYFCGRKKESIRRGGENITPMKSRKFSSDHPAVAEAAAVGVPDPILGEEIKAYLVLRAGQRVEPWELIATCEERLPKFMIPAIWNLFPPAEDRLRKSPESIPEIPGIGSAWIDWSTRDP